MSLVQVLKVPIHGNLPPCIYLHLEIFIVIKNIEKCTEYIFFI